MPPVDGVLANEHATALVGGVPDEDEARLTVVPRDEVCPGVTAEDKLQVGAHPAVLILDALANRARAPFAARQETPRIGVVRHGCLQSATNQWLGPGEGFLLGRDHPFPIGQRLLCVDGVPLDAEALGSDPAEVATLMEGTTIQRPETPNGHLVNVDQLRKISGADPDPGGRFIGIHNGCYAG